MESKSKGVEEDLSILSSMKAIFSTRNFGREIVREDKEGKMKNKNMSTPEEYNKKYFRRLEKLQEQATHTGVRCPKCSEEMLYSDTAILTTNPPQRYIHCPKCKYDTRIYC